MVFLAVGLTRQTQTAIVLSLLRFQRAELGVDCNSEKLHQNCSSDGSKDQGEAAETKEIKQDGNTKKAECR